ncbi:Coatomer subunit epsilon-2 [Durusdinium trenchii]|uniref:Coatomer subunit epsilon-2 n=1 Tax=Durusdinium trenchii TaxID=1381693 RepID=A0ABP0RC28_9DINO
MQRGMFSEAVEDLQRALSSNPNDPDSLVNMCCCMTHLGKKDEFQQYYSKLEQVAPTNPFVLKTQAGKQCWRQTGIILISNLYLYIYRSLKSFGVYILHLSISMFQIFPVYLYIAQ